MMFLQDREEPGEKHPIKVEGRNATRQEDRTLARSRPILAEAIICLQHHLLLAFDNLFECRLGKAHALVSLATLLRERGASWSSVAAGRLRASERAALLRAIAIRWCPRWFCWWPAPTQRPSSQRSATR